MTTRQYLEHNYENFNTFTWHNLCFELQVDIKHRERIRNIIKEHLGITIMPMNHEMDKTTFFDIVVSELK